MGNTLTIASRLMADLQRDYGLTREQAAGVVGNMAHETAGFTQMQERGTKKGGYGYAQWTGARRTAFENWTKGQGLDPTSYEANYGFLKHELAKDRFERQKFQKVKKAETAAEAARIVSKQFLRPGVPHISSRLAWTDEILDADAPAPPTPAGLPPADARMAYAASLPELPRARPVTPAPRRVTTDDIIRASTTPQNVDQTLQAALNARYPATPRALPAAYNPVTPAQKAAMTAMPAVRTAQLTPMPAGLPQAMPGVSSWDDFYSGILPSAPKVAAPKAPAMPSLPRADPRTALEKTWAGTSFAKAEDAAKRAAQAPAPRPVTDATIARTFTSSYAPIASQQAALKEAARIAAPTPTIATFQPVGPIPSAGPGYNQLTSAQRNALSALPSPAVAHPNYAPKSQTQLRTAEVEPPTSYSVAPLYNPAHPLVRKDVPTAAPLVSAPTGVSVPLPRPRPAAPAIPASLAQPAQIAAPPTNLGPVKNFLGMPNAVPKSFAVAPNAPLPAPRLDRPGIFGNPNIGGVSIPLPGVLGVIQNATKAMNNASGPFNNGLDNSIYQGLRGGNFTAPGAATHIGTNGFLYAPKAGGGFVNVGRAPAGTPTGAKGPSTFSTAKERIYERGALGRSGAEYNSISS